MIKDLIVRIFIMLACQQNLLQAHTSKPFGFRNLKNDRILINNNNDSSNNNSNNNNSNNNNASTQDFNNSKLSSQTFNNTNSSTILVQTVIQFNQPNGTDISTQSFNINNSSTQITKVLNSSALLVQTLIQVNQNNSNTQTQALNLTNSSSQVFIVNNSSSPLLQLNVFNSTNPSAYALNVNNSSIQLSNGTNSSTLLVSSVVLVNTSNDNNSLPQTFNVKNFSTQVSNVTNSSNLLVSTVIQLNTPNATNSSDQSNNQQTSNIQQVSNNQQSSNLNNSSTQASQNQSQTAQQLATDLYLFQATQTNKNQINNSLSQQTNNANESNQASNTQQASQVPLADPFLINNTLSQSSKVKQQRSNSTDSPKRATNVIVTSAPQLNSTSLMLSQAITANGDNSSNQTSNISNLTTNISNSSTPLQITQNIIQLASNANESLAILQQALNQASIIQGGSQNSSSIQESNTLNNNSNISSNQSQIESNQSSITQTINSSNQSSSQSVTNQQTPLIQLVDTNSSSSKLYQTFATFNSYYGENQTCSLITSFLYLQTYCVPKSCVEDKLRRVQLKPLDLFNTNIGNLSNGIVYSASVVQGLNGTEYQVIVSYNDQQNDQLVSDPENCIDYRIYENVNSYKINQARQYSSFEGSVPTWPQTAYSFNQSISAGQITFNLSQTDMDARKCVRLANNGQVQWECFFELAFVIRDITQISYYFSIIITVDLGATSSAPAVDFVKIIEIEKCTVNCTITVNINSSLLFCQDATCVNVSETPFYVLYVNRLFWMIQRIDDASFNQTYTIVNVTLSYQSFGLTMILQANNYRLTKQVAGHNIYEMYVPIVSDQVLISAGGTLQQLSSTSQRRILDNIKVAQKKDYQINAAQFVQLPYQVNPFVKNYFHPLNLGNETAIENGLTVHQWIANQNQSYFYISLSNLLIYIYVCKDKIVLYFSSICKNLFTQTSVSQIVVLKNQMFSLQKSVPGSKGNLRQGVSLNQSNNPKPMIADSMNNKSLLTSNKMITKNDTTIHQQNLIESIVIPGSRGNLRPGDIVLPGSKANLRSGVFSNHSNSSKPNNTDSLVNTSFQTSNRIITPQDTTNHQIESIDVNLEKTKMFQYSFMQEKLLKEKQKFESSQKIVVEQSSLISHLKDVVTQVTMSSIDFLGSFQQQIEELQPTQEFEKTIQSVVYLLKLGIQLVFEIIETAQQLNLPDLKNFEIPEIIDFQSFFQFVEIQCQNNQELQILMRDTIPNDSQSESYEGSQELSFRHKPSASSQLHVSLPTPQVQQKKSTSSSIQEQFNTFLQLQEENENMPDYIQTESPYFTHGQPVQVAAQKRSIDMPLQMNPSKKKQQSSKEKENNAQNLILQSNKNRFQTELAETMPTIEPPLESQNQQVHKQVLLENFYSFKNDTKEKQIKPEQDQRKFVMDLDGELYDSLLINPKNVQSKQMIPSMQIVNYVDQKLNPRSCEQGKKKIQSTDTHQVHSKIIIGKYQNNLDQIQDSSDKENQSILINNSQNDTNKVKNRQQCEKSQQCNNVWAIAKFKFTAQSVQNQINKQKDDINFSKGDKIQVMEMKSNGWWVGKEMISGKIGHFPYNYVLIQE